MKYKPDWEDAQERLTKLWEGKPLDRPCLSVTAPSGAGVEAPPLPEDGEARWMDPDFLVPHARAQLANQWWGGEAAPSYLTMCGWCVCLGGTPHFDHRTIWFDTMEVDFDQPSPFHVREDDEWVKKHERAYIAMAEFAGEDDFLLGAPCILPANDLLSMLMGTEAFLVALMDHPEWMKRAILDAAKDLEAERARLNELVRRTGHRYWYGIPGWMPLWGPKPFRSSQSDVSCMLSKSMFDEFILPDIEYMASQTGLFWYHLDGGDARQHTQTLLSVPELRIMQYVATANEPPNGVGQLPLYREIQEAGRIVHVVVPAGDIEELIRELDPNLMLLQTRCASIKEGEELLAAAKRWASAKTPR